MKNDKEGLKKKENISVKRSMSGGRMVVCPKAFYYVP